MDARAEKNFIRINVSDPGDQLLVEQNRFQCSPMIDENSLELGEADVERVWAEAAFFQKLIDILD